MTHHIDRKVNITIPILVINWQRLSGEINVISGQVAEVLFS